MHRTRVISILLLTSLAGGPAIAGKLYRWVDENGNVQFTDKIPPSEVKRSHQLLNEDGITTETIKRAKTKEEVEREREVERLRAEQQRLVEKQRAADRVLLRTFRSADDMMLARNGKLEAIEIGIRIAQSNIRRYQKKLTELQHRAATRERSAQTVPSPLVTNIQSVVDQINVTYGLIRRKEQEQQAVRDTFARDLKRFRTLKKTQPQQQVVKEREPRSLDNVLPCGKGAACQQAWKRAETFVRKYATTPMQMLADNIIMTAAPVRDQDISITVSRLQEEDDGEPVLFMDLFCKETPLGKELCASPKVTAIRRAYRQEVGGLAP
jgi:hypothetical protein